MGEQEDKIEITHPMAVIMAIGGGIENHALLLNQNDKTINA